MKEVNVLKASPITRNEPVEDVCIKVTGDVLEGMFSRSLKEAEGIYTEQAELIVSALHKALPQGTMHFVLMKLLKTYPSYYAGVL